jgi:hypothetical protein
MAVHGYGHDQMLIYLKEEGVKYNPDIVILGYADTDRNMLEFGSYAKPRFKLVNNKLKVYNFPVPTPETTLKWEPWRLKFFDLLNISMFEIYKKSGFYKKEKEEIKNSLLKSIVNTVNGIGAVPIFVYLDNVRSKDDNVELTEKEKTFLDQCKDFSISCAFVRQNVLSARQSGVRIKEDGHFGPETNQLVAQGIKKYLLKNNFLKKE